jgi:hypothetical protein
MNEYDKHICLEQMCVGLDSQADGFLIVEGGQWTIRKFYISNIKIFVYCSKTLSLNKISLELNEHLTGNLKTLFKLLGGLCQNT